MCDTVCSPEKINLVCGGMMMMSEEWGYGSDILVKTCGYRRFLQRSQERLSYRKKKEELESGNNHVSL